MGLIRLASLNTTKAAPSRRVFGCVNTMCLRFTTTMGCEVLRRRVTVVILVRGYVNEMLFIVFFLDTQENSNLSFISCYKGNAAVISDNPSFHALHNTVT